MLDQILDFIKRYRGKIIIILLIILLILILIKTGVMGFIIGLLIIFFSNPIVQWILLIAALLLSLWFLYKAIKDWWTGGKLTGSGPCQLRVFDIKPDKCEAVTCTTFCIAKKGPYPAWMKSWAPSTQDVSCLCAAAAPSKKQAIIDILDQVKEQVLDIDLLQQLKNIIYELLGSGEISSGCLDRIWPYIMKKQAGESFTKDEVEEIKKILRECDGE